MTLGKNPKVWSIITVAVLLTVFCGVSLGQDDTDAAGNWDAQVPGPGGETTITLSLVNTDGQWSGQISSVADGAGALRNISINGRSVEFTYDSLSSGQTLSFVGTIDEENRVLAGEINSPAFPASLPVKFIKNIDSISTPDGGKKYTVGSGPEGIWIGQVRSPNGEERPVTLTIDNVNGEHVITLEDPFVDTIRGQDINVNDTMISFTFRPEGADYPSHFTGTYIAADDRVSGSFSQRGASRFVKFRRDPSTVILGLTKDGEIIEPQRKRHLHKFAVTGRLSYWAAMHMVRDEVYTMNNITTSKLNYDLGLRWHARDAFVIFGRYYHGNQGFSDDSKKLAAFEDIGLNADSNLKLDGWELGLTGYFGNVFNEDSRFNPYMTAAIGKVSWEVTEGDRGSQVLDIDDDLLMGKDLSFGFGFGTEYEMSSSFNLEFEWMWRYFATQDETLWKNINEEWNNTHTWALSAGLTYLFF